MNPTRLSAELTVHFVCDPPLLPNDGGIRVVIQSVGRGLERKQQRLSSRQEQWRTQELPSVCSMPIQWI
jgi:hypothetical protein